MELLRDYFAKGLKGKRLLFPTFLLAMTFLNPVVPNSFAAIIYFESGAEKGCPGEWSPSSQCQATNNGLVESVPSPAPVRSGTYSFKHPVDPSISDQTGKLALPDSDELDVALNGGSGEAYFSAWFYLDEGFIQNVNANSMLMQWKLGRPKYLDPISGAINPKAMVRVTGINGIRQIYVTVWWGTGNEVFRYNQTSPKSFPVQQWVHVETYYRTSGTNGQIRVWQNGEEIFNISGINTLTKELGDNTQSQNTTLYYGIGAYMLSGTPAGLYIMYTDDSIITDYQISATPPPVGPVGYWPFEEGAGQTAQDASGNGNTGTLIAMLKQNGAF